MSDKRPTLSLSGKDQLWGLGSDRPEPRADDCQTYLLYFSIRTSPAWRPVDRFHVFGLEVDRLLRLCRQSEPLLTDEAGGKSRPYFLWLAAPLALLTILTVLTPHFPGAGNPPSPIRAYNLLIIVLSVGRPDLGAIVPSISHRHFGERAELGAIGGAFGIGAILAVSYRHAPLGQSPRRRQPGDGISPGHDTLRLAGFCALAGHVLSHAGTSIPAVATGAGPLRLDSSSIPMQSSLAATDAGPGGILDRGHHAYADDGLSL